MIPVLKNAAYLGGKVLKNYFKKQLTISEKFSHQDFYTQADVAAQSTIKESIISQLVKKGVKESDIGFIGEENLIITGKKHLFVIDPLDGTVNFASNYGHFAVSIGYFENGKNKAGIIYHPISRDAYCVVKNKGAFKNNERLKIEYRPLKECLTNAYISSRPDIYHRLLKLHEKILPKIRALRNLNCMTLDAGFFAENIFQILINGHTYIWDIAASKLLIEEAGGVIFDFKGNPVDFNFKNPRDPYEIIVSHPKLKDSLMEIIKS